MKKRMLSLLTALSLCLTLLPAPAMAVGQEDTGMCPHHREHTAECGYRPPAEGAPCQHEHGPECYAQETVCLHIHDESCYSDGVLPNQGEDKAADTCQHACSEETGCVTAVLNCRHVHDEACGYAAANPGHPCEYNCRVCPVQALIDALPDEWEITADNAEEVSAQLDAIDRAKDGLTDDELDALDAAPYMAAAAALEALARQAGANVVMPLAGTLAQEDGWYLIGSKDDLYAFAAMVNGGTTNANAKLTADIVVNQKVLDADGNLNSGTFEPWTPIGNRSNTFEGTFDGGGHTVSGLYFNNTGVSYVGLFGCFGGYNASQNSVIRNVGVVDSYFNGQYRVGGVCGHSSGTITNCYNTSTVKGYAEEIGGVCGYSEGIITDCYNTGTVSGSYDVGGVCGSSYDGDGIENCYNTGAVTGTSNVGGVCGGQSAGRAIENCYNTGTVSGSRYIGGVCGWNDATTENCYNTGAVSGTEYVGGVCGINNECGTIENCYYLDTSCESPGSGTSITAAEFAAMTDFTGFDSNVWMPSPLGRPVLQSNAEGGTGTAEDPFRIGTKEELKNFAAMVNGGSTSICAKLTADIVVNDDVLDSSGNPNSGTFTPWTPIGTDSHPFEGTFDGQGHTISGLYCEGMELNSAFMAGLFGFLNEQGTIKNVGVTDSYFKAIVSAGVCALSAGTIENCWNESTVAGFGDKMACIAGGVCAMEFKPAYIKNCYNTGTVTAKGNEDYNIITGGVCGESVGTVTNCYNTGTVSAAGGATNIITGGVCGESVGTVTNCYYLDSSCSTSDGDTSKSAEAFASGEVAWLLQNGQTNQTWGQQLSGSKDTAPVLTAETAKKVYQISFQWKNDGEDYIEYAAKYTNPGGTVALPTPPTSPKYQFVKWSQTQDTGGTEFTASTKVNSDLTVYAVGQEQYGQTEGDKTITTTYGSAVEQDLSAYMVYGGTTAVTGKFTYAINSGNGDGYFSIDGDKLKVSSTTPAGTYELTITATEKSPQISVFAANGLGTSPVEISVTVKVSPKTIETAVIGSIADLIYTGEGLTPDLTVRDGDKVLARDTDYTLAYSNNINVGTGDVEVTGIGNYTGTVTKQFTIDKADQPTPIVNINYTDETLSTSAAMEWSTDGSTWTACTENMNISACGWDGSAKTVQFRTAGDTNHNPSQAKDVSIPARPAAPDAAIELTKAADSITITNADSACEYSVDGLTWNNGTFTGLTAGTEYTVKVRLKATSTDFRSAEKSQTVTTVNADGSTTLKPGETVETGDGTTVTNNGDTVTTETGGTTTTITPPSGGNVDVDGDGSVEVPGGSTVQTGDGPQITTGGDGSTVGGDGSVTVPGGGSVTIPDGEGGETTITVPEGGGTITPTEDGKVEIPGGSTVTTDDGPQITTGGDGSTVGGNGSVTVPGGGSVTIPDGEGGETTITVPEGGGSTITPTEDGKVEVPGGSTVQVGDNPPVTIPSTGGSVTPSGEIKYDVTVNFDTQDGKPTTSQTIPVGGKATKPIDDPTRSGYTFDGWYIDADGRTAWDFDTAVTGSMTLYAKWTVKYIGGGDIGGGSSSSKPTVTIGGDGGGGKVETGSDGTATITPEDGYEIIEITVNGEEVEIPEDGKLTGLKRTDKVVVTFGKLPTHIPVSQRFIDVPAGAWFEEAVQFAVDNGLFYGTSDTTFSPNSNMTRGMLATVLYRLAKEPGAKVDDLFNDVADGMYYTEAITWAAENGIVAGYGGGLFGPDDPITREQLATILWRYAGRPAVPNLILPFSDADRASAYAMDALRWAVGEGILTGKGNGILDPAGKATRAQVAAMLMRYYEAFTE